jgi:alpha-L-fucosidase 2
LPALPKAWAASGKVTGIGARGGFCVDLAWGQGKVTSVTVRSVGGEKTRLKWGAWSKAITLQSGESITIAPGEA